VTGDTIVNAERKVILMEKPADTQYPVLDVIRRRWSPRAFSDRPIEPAKVKRLFEAARWSASSFNEQPWRFIVATQQQPDAFAQVLACLKEGNQGWACHAPLLGLTVSKKTFSRNDKLNRVHVHDIGLAMSQLSLQAMDMDLFVHQMAGIEIEKTIETFHVPNDFEPVTGFAVGYPGDPNQLPEKWMRDAELASRPRKPLPEFVFTGRFGEASPLVQESERDQ
jgi:nitroreductase